MPSLSHESLLLLFRNRPELAPDLLREALGVELPEYTEVRIESADLTDVVPAEYRADLVVLLVNGKPVLAIVVEVQLSRNDRKRFTWPVYVAEVRARFECPATVLVVAPSREVVRWAAEPISLGPGGILAPMVLGPDAVPVVTDEARATAEPELALLSVLAHGGGDVEQAVQIAVAAVAGVRHILDAERLMLYSDLIESALSDAARKALEMIPPGYQFQSETVRNAIAKGRLESKVDDVLAVLDSRGIVLSDEQRARIEACTDVETLKQWIRRAVTIATVDELFI